MVSHSAGDAAVDSDQISPVNGAPPRPSSEDDDRLSMLRGANNATKTEKSMTIKEAFKTYPKAVIFSMVLSTAIIMEGYDIVLLASLYAFPSFNKRFGEPTGVPEAPYQIPATWQAGLANGAQIGEILGLFINGIVSERYGYRKTMIAALVSVIAFIFIPFFARNLIDLEVGEVLCGIPWGVFQTLTTVYASDVCPTQLRAYLTTYVNLCWVVGQLIGAGILRSLLPREDQWSYRIPFAVQWVWPVPIIVGVLLAPESPWWLVRRGRIEDAKKSVRALISTKNAHSDFSVDDAVALMITTNEFEKSIESGTGYLNCFRGYDLRRTEITCGVWVVQMLCGSAMMAYSTYFYEQAGLPITQAFNLSLAQYVLGFIGTTGSWFLMGFAGRRTIYLFGLCILCVLLLLIGLVALSSSTAAAWGIGSLLLTYVFVYDLTVGPVCYSLVSEMPSTRLKTKTIVLGRNMYNVVSIISQVITPFMLNPTAWNWRGKTGFFWCGICFLCVIWTYFRLPEPKGRTYGELDLLFEKRISAREFSTTDVSSWSSNTTTGKPECEITAKEKLDARPVSPISLGSLFRRATL